MPARWRSVGPLVQPGHESELRLLAPRRNQEQVLVEPVDGGEVEAFGPGEKEAEEELPEEILEQHLEALVVIRSG